MKTVEMEPNEPTAHMVLAGVYAETGMFDEWIEEYHLALVLRGEAGLAEHLSRVYVEAGYRGTMQRAAEEMVVLSKGKYVSAAEIARAQSGTLDTSVDRSVEPSGLEAFRHIVNRYAGVGLELP